MCEANSDAFSRQSIHELNQCAVPCDALFDQETRAFGRREQHLSLGHVLVGCTAGIQDMGCKRNDFRIDDPSNTSGNLPTELLQAIYGYLSPLDFNAARHTCITWMMASMKLEILVEQLKRGGWWSGASTKAILSGESRQTWALSCCFSRQCALAGNWTGQGLSSQGQAHCSPMIESCEANFGSLLESALRETKHQQSGSPQMCSTSICGKYATMTSESKIYTYEIEGRSLRLLSRTSCERQVLSVTVDATPKGFVIAAVLEGRIGLYIDVLGKSEPLIASSPWETAGTLNHTSTAFAPIMHLRGGDGAGACEVTVGDLDELSLNAGSIGESSFLHQSVEIATQRTWTEYLHSPRAHVRGFRQLPASCNGVWPNDLNFTEQRRCGKSEDKSRAQIVYRNVCTENDPPTAIAISPTRQCVAFGCKAGVELYWIDPTTGQNLNRYFPLTNPSHRLYFLPPRRNIDNSSRLRLISSATYKPSREENEDARPAHTSNTRTWLTLPRSWRFPAARTARPLAHNIDHSYAIPLSDGHHILFTDNETGLLCLGSDKPAGNLQRLSRKFVFEPPVSLSNGIEASASTVYAAAHNLSNGIRIAAAYGDNIVLYSVTVDAIRYSTAEQEGTIQDSSESFEELEWLEILPHPTSNAHAVQEIVEGSAVRYERLNMLWTRFLPSIHEEQESSLDKMWPLRIQGTGIGSLGGLKALSVQETVMDGLVIWGFSTSGQAKAWEVDNGRRPFVMTYRNITPDGIVREGEVPNDETS